MGNCAQWITVVEALASRHTRRSVGTLAARRFERGVAQEGCGRSDLRTSDLDELEQWIAWQAVRVQQRKPEELRVVYLCGPEPLNDLHVLLELGVSPHNIWGVESNEAAYRSALKELAQECRDVLSSQLTSFRTTMARA